MNGMTEIKPGIKIRIKNIFLMHPVAVAVVVVLFVLVLFGGCSTAKASETADVYDEIEAYYFANMSTSNKQAIRNVVFDTDRPLKYYFIAYNTAYLQNHNAIIIFSEYPEIMVNAVCSIPEGNYQGTLSGSYITWQIYNDNRNCRIADNNDYTSCKMAAIWVDGGSNPWGALFDYYRSGQSSTASIPYWIYKFTSRTAIGGLSLGSNRGVEATVHGYKSNAVFFNNYGAVMNNTDPIPSDYVEDNRLRLSVLSDSYGDDFLRIDFTRFMVGDNNYTSNSFHDVVVEMNADDNNITVDIDDISTIADTQPNIRYIRDVLLSKLGLDDYENVTITAVTFVQTVTVLQMSQDYQYSILCDYRLKGSSFVPSMLDLEYDDDTSVGKISQVVIDEIADQVNFQEGYYSPMGGGGQQLVVPDGFNVKYVMIYGSKPLSSVIQSFIDGNFISGLTSLNDYIVDAVFGITSSDGAKEYIDGSVRDNHYTQSYDIVVYYWCPDSSLGEVDVMYYYLTSCGRLRQANQLLADIYVEANQTAYNTYAIYDFLYNRLNDFENKTLETLGLIKTDTAEGISWLQSLNSSVLGLEDVVSNGIMSIIASIPNAFDDSGILDVLVDILDAIGDISSDNEDDTVAEAISYYLAHNDNGYPTSQVFAEHKMSLWFSGKVHNYLEGSSIDDTRQLTLMYAFDAFRGAWDTIRSDNSYFGAIGEYLQSFSGEPMNNANGNIHYIQHIWTDSFDPSRYDGLTEE